MADQANDPQLERLELLWESDPSSKVYLELAEAYRETGRTEDAVRVLETSLQHRPRDPRGRVALARCRLDQKDTAAATELLEDVTRQDPAHVLANKLLLEAYLRDGDAAKAEERLNIYRLLNDRDPELDHLEYRLEGLLSNVPVSAAESEAEDGSAKPTEAPEQVPDGAADDASGEETPTEMVRALAVEAGASTLVASGPASPSSEPETIESADSPAFELAPIESQSESTEELETTEATAALQSRGGEPAEASTAAQDDGDDLSTGSEPTAATEPMVGPATPDGPSQDGPTPDGPSQDGPSQDEEDLYRMTVDAGDEPTVALEPEPDPAAGGTPAFVPSAQESSGGAVFEMVDEADAEAPEADVFPQSPATAPTGPSSNDLFDLGPPAPAPNLDALFDLGASPPPAPSLDDLWGAPAESEQESEPSAESEPVIDLSAEDAPTEDADEAPPVAAATEESDDDASESVASVETDGEDGGREPATVTLGELYLSQGHRDEAERIFRRVLADDPENRAARAALQQLESPEVEEAPEAEARESDDPVAVVEAPEPEARESAEAAVEAPELDAPVVEAPEPAAEESAEPVVEAPEPESPELESPELDAPELDVPSREDEPAEPVVAATDDVQAVETPAAETPAADSHTADAAGVDEATGDVEPAVASETAAEPTAAEAAGPTTAETADEAWPIAAPSLLADRSLAGVVPEGLTAKKILVLNQYLQHLRTAARHNVR